MSILKSKPGSQYLNRFRQNFYGNKWKYVFQEGMLKGGIFMFVFVYGMGLIMEFAAWSWKAAVFYFLAFILGEIPLSLFFYHQYAKQIESEEYVGSEPS